MYMVNYDGNDKKKAIEISIEDYNDIIIGLSALAKFDDFYCNVFDNSWSREIGCIPPADLMREFTTACMFNENIITDREKIVTKKSGYIKRAIFALSFFIAICV